MSKVIFNEFKKRFLNGEVKAKDEWTFIPVNSTFAETYKKDDIDYSYFKTVKDFSDFNSDVLTFEDGQYKGSSILSGYKTTLTYEKVIDDSDFSNQPIYVNNENAQEFLNTFFSHIPDHDSPDFPKELDKEFPEFEHYFSSGFYWIRSKDELTWFANRVNEGDNKIIGIFGDNIEGKIETHIGTEEFPFEGILDGLGYALENIEIECNETDNGIVGVLGTHGKVKNFYIKNTKNDTINLKNAKKINLNHLKTDARDINASILVGKNFGEISNIKVDLNNSGSFKFSGFSPEVYSVTNKSDNYTFSDDIRDKFDNNKNNYYFLNSWCLDSPGNLCPYVGYFAEGYFGMSSAAERFCVLPEDPNYKFWISSAYSFARNIKDRAWKHNEGGKTTDWATGFKTIRGTTSAEFPCSGDDLPYRKFFSKFYKEEFSARDNTYKQNFTDLIKTSIAPETGIGYEDESLNNTKIYQDIDNLFAPNCEVYYNHYSPMYNNGTVTGKLYTFKPEDENNLARITQFNPNAGSDDYFLTTYNCPAVDIKISEVFDKDKYETSLDDFIHNVDFTLFNCYDYEFYKQVALTDKDKKHVPYVMLKNEDEFIKVEVTEDDFESVPQFVEDYFNGHDNKITIENLYKYVIGEDLPINEECITFAYKEIINHLNRYEVENRIENLKLLSLIWIKILAAASERNSLYLYMDEATCRFDNTIDSFIKKLKNEDDTTIFGQKYCSITTQQGTMYNDVLNVPVIETYAGRDFKLISNSYNNYFFTYPLENNEDFLKMYGDEQNGTGVNHRNDRPNKYKQEILNSINADRYKQFGNDVNHWYRRIPLINLYAFAKNLEKQRKLEDNIIEEIKNRTINDLKTYFNDKLKENTSSKLVDFLFKVKVSVKEKDDETPNDDYNFFPSHYLLTQISAHLSDYINDLKNAEGNCGTFFSNLETYRSNLLNDEIKFLDIFQAVEFNHNDGIIDNTELNKFARLDFRIHDVFKLEQLEHLYKSFKQIEPFDDYNYKANNINVSLTKDPDNNEDRVLECYPNCVLNIVNLFNNRELEAKDKNTIGIIPQESLKYFLYVSTEEQDVKMNYTQILKLLKNDGQYDTYDVFHSSAFKQQQQFKFNDEMIFTLPMESIWKTIDGDDKNEGFYFGKHEWYKDLNLLNGEHDLGYVENHLTTTTTGPLNFYYLSNYCKVSDLKEKEINLVYQSDSYYDTLFEKLNENYKKLEPTDKVKINKYKRYIREILGTKTKWEDYVDHYKNTKENPKNDDCDIINDSNGMDYETKVSNYIPMNFYLRNSYNVEFNNDKDPFIDPNVKIDDIGKRSDAISELFYSEIDPFLNNYNFTQFYFNDYYFKYKTYNEKNEAEYKFVNLFEYISNSLHYNDFNKKLITKKTSLKKSLSDVKPQNDDATWWYNSYKGYINTHPIASLSGHTVNNLYQVDNINKDDTKEIEEFFTAKEFNYALHILNTDFIFEKFKTEYVDEFEIYVKSNHNCNYEINTSDKPEEFPYIKEIYLDGILNNKKISHSSQKIHVTNPLVLKNSFDFKEEGIEIPYTTIHYAAYRSLNFIKYDLSVNSRNFKECLSYSNENLNTIASHPKYYGVDQNNIWTSNVRGDQLLFNWNLFRESIQKYDYSSAGIGLNLYYSTKHSVLNEYKMDYGDVSSNYQYGQLEFQIPKNFLDIPMRMQQNERSEYNIAPVVGSNFGTIAFVSADVKLNNAKSNVVGFIGGLVGQQERGAIQNVYVKVEPDFELTNLNDNLIKYKTTPIIPTEYGQFDELDTEDLIVSEEGKIFGEAVNKSYVTNDIRNFYKEFDVYNTYELNPIIKFGGLFGKFVPTVYSTLIKNIYLEPTNFKTYKVADSPLTPPNNVTKLKFNNNTTIMNDVGIFAGKMDISTDMLTLTTETENLPKHLTFSNINIINSESLSAYGLFGLTHRKYTDNPAIYDYGYSLIYSGAYKEEINKKYGETTGLYPVIWKGPSADFVQGGKYNITLPFDVSFDFNHGRAYDISHEDSNGSAISYASAEDVPSSMLYYSYNAANGKQHIFDNQYLQKTTQFNTFIGENNTTLEETCIDGNWFIYLTNLHDETAINFKNYSEEIPFTTEMNKVESKYSTFEKQFISNVFENNFWLNNDLSKVGEIPVQLECYNFRSSQNSTNQITPIFPAWQWKNNYTQKLNSGLYNFNVNTAMEVTSTLNNETIFTKSDKQDNYFYYSAALTDSAKSANFIQTLNIEYLPYTSEVSSIDEKGQTITTNKNAVGYLIETNTSGYGDGFEYGNHVLALGKSYSQNEIMNTIKDEGKFVIDNISANDFAGMLVVDSEGNNVMFMENEDSIDLDKESYNYFLPSAIDLNNKKRGVIIEVE